MIKTLVQLQQEGVDYKRLLPKDGNGIDKNRYLFYVYCDKYIMFDKINIKAFDLFKVLKSTLKKDTEINLHKDPFIFLLGKPFKKGKQHLCGADKRDFCFYIKVQDVIEYLEDIYITDLYNNEPSIGRTLRDLGVFKTQTPLTPRIRECVIANFEERIYD